MPARRLTLPAVATLAVACVVLGVLAALADGQDHRRAAQAATPVPAQPRYVRAVRPRATVQKLRAAVAARGGLVSASGRYRRYLAAVPPTVFPVCTPAATAKDAPAAEPVPGALTAAFGVLRREKTPGDTLAPEALTALRARGLEPFDPTTARLLRTTADGGRAWVVPVRDVSNRLIAQVGCAIRVLNPKTRPPVSVQVPAPAAAPTTPTPTVTTPTTPSPARPAAPKTHPGLAVVALGGAPAGAGGRLEDLVRGREPVAIDACGGPNHDMLSVSGIVPDGVAAAFLTSPDGTAVRADVKDNAYAFVVPRAKQPEDRYVVWTGGDGTPHVQPLGAQLLIPAARCATLTKHRATVVVSPDGATACSFPQPRVQTPTIFYRSPCALPAVPIIVTPKAIRVPRRHK